MKVVFRKSALSDIATIHAYIARDNLDAADWTVARIRLATDLLGVFPNVGREGNVAGTRELIIARLPYIVVYSTSPLTIEIIAVFHFAENRGI